MNNQCPLPPLPASEAYVRTWSDKGEALESANAAYFTAEQMRAYATAAVEAAVEAERQPWTPRPLADFMEGFPALQALAERLDAEKATIPDDRAPVADWQAEFWRERGKFAAETLRASKLADVIERLLARLKTLGCDDKPWAKQCTTCDLMIEARELLSADVALSLRAALTQAQQEKKE